MKISWLGILPIWASGIPLTPGGPYRTDAASKPGAINVHLVPHTHDDVGWLKTIDELFLGSRNDIQLSAVQYILDSVVESLSEDKNRKFIYVEMAFFSRWWRRQNQSKRAQVRELIKNGQLEFINGGWASNDEATPTYLDIADQHAMGAEFIAREFGSRFNPTVGWQVDPFGHSMFQAKAYDRMGMNSWFFGRTDSQDFANRNATHRLESIHSSVLAGSMDGYGPPPGFDWNIFSSDEPLNDDPYLGTPNIERRLEAFVEACVRQAASYNLPSETAQHIMLTMGSDFQYEYARTWFSNMDKLIHYANLDGRLNVFYSTPTIYTQARADQAKTRWTEIRSDYDWFPYCDSDQTKADENGEITHVDGHAFWTGYFTSRPLLKRLVREASTVLELCQIVELLTVSPGKRVEEIENPVWLLREALAVAQHHDGVSGTSRQHVADDYTRRLTEGINACKDMINSSFLSQPRQEEIDRAVDDSRYHSFTTGDNVQEVKAPVKDVEVKVSFAYYRSSLGNTDSRTGQASGAYIFRPECPEGNVRACRPIPIPPTADWVKYEVFEDRVEWEVGPIPQDEGLVGKEVVLLIEGVGAGKIENSGVFYTDANGYQWMERRVNTRATWEQVVTDPVAGNYYPVVGGIAIVDSKAALVVTPDRSVGGSSLVDNQIEIMIHRRLFKDDMRGVVEPLNERGVETGEGIVVKGTTWFTVYDMAGKVGGPPVVVPQAQLRPPVKVARANVLQSVKSFVKVPAGPIRLLHIHRVDIPEICQLSGKTDCVLLRLMHTDTNETAGSDGAVEVDLSQVIAVKAVIRATETVLHGGQRRDVADKRKIHWTKQGEHDSTGGVQSRGRDALVVKISPGEIRTFILETMPFHPEVTNEMHVITSDHRHMYKIEVV